MHENYIKKLKEKVKVYNAEIKFRRQSIIVIRLRFYQSTIIYFNHAKIMYPIFKLYVSIIRKSMEIQ